LPDVAPALHEPQLADTLGLWLRMLHERGVEHTDLHANNVIATADPERPLVLLDVGDVLLHRGAVPEPRWIAMIARLFGRDERFPPALRRAVLRASLAPEANRDPALLERWSAEVERVRDALRRGHRFRQARRALGRGTSRFVERRHRSLQLWLPREVDPDRIAPLLDEIARSATAARAHADREVALGPLGVRAARRAFRAAVALALWEIDAPRPLALVRRRTRRWLVLERVAARPLPEALAGTRTPEQRAACARALGRALARAHAAGLSGFAHRGLAGFELPLVTPPGERTVAPAPETLAHLRLEQRPSEQRLRTDLVPLLHELGDRCGDAIASVCERAYREQRLADMPWRNRPADLALPPRPRIAIVKVGALGDVINTLPLAVALRERFPDAEIAWVVGPLARPLVEHHPAVDHVIPYPRRDWRRLADCVRALRAFRPDVVIDAGRQLKTAVLARLSGARWRIGFDRARSKEGAWRFANVRTPEAIGHAPVLEHYLELGALLGAPTEPVRWQIDPGADARRRVQALLPPAAGPLVAMTVSATKPANLWPPERLASLAARAVRERGAQVVLVGGPGEDERRRGALVAALAGPGVHDRTGRTTLHELAALLERADVVLAHDTGPMHLAVALGRPVVSIFGAADPLRTGPWRQLDGLRRVALACRPCRRRTCPLGTRACLGLLPAEQPWPAVAEALSHRRPASTPAPDATLRVRTERRGAWRLWWDPDHAPAALIERLERLPELFETEQLEIFNRCATAITGRWSPPDGPPLFVKRYRDRHRLDACKNLLRRSRARRAWEAGRRLFAMGVRTGLPVALALRKRFGRVVDSFVVTREVEHEGSVLEAFRDRRHDPREKQRLIRAAALHLRLLHERRIGPGDLKGTNWLVCERDGVLGFAHIDLDRQRFDRPVRHRDRVRNLVYLDTSFGSLPSRTDRLRFLRTYLGAGWRDREAVRRMIAEIEAGVAERRPRRPPPLESP
ncbi:MAG: hypothetical protein D6776_06765, partial [Planctomycetota bacterium]